MSGLVIRPKVGQAVEDWVNEGLPVGQNFMTISQLVKLTDVTQALAALAANDKMTDVERMDQQFGQAYFKAVNYMSRNGMQCMADAVGSRVLVGPAIAIDDGRVQS